MKYSEKLKSVHETGVRNGSRVSVTSWTFRSKRSGKESVCVCVRQFVVKSRTPHS
ncbi:MAG: hypothetical protein IJK98_06345 [Clostridia bacterium]|nr:hypothetical protein [Clostridia bacterium]